MSPTLFFKYVSISFQRQVTYRFDCFVGILNGFLYVFIFTSLWKALYSQFDTREHNGFSLQAIIAYAVMAMAIRISFSMDDSIVYKKVQDGSIATDIIKPVSFFFMNLAENIGHSLFHILARTFPIVVISIFMYNISISVKPSRLLLFFFSALFGYLLLSMLNFIVGLFAFWFIEIFPFMLFKYALFTFFSGGIVPIDFFPESLKPLLNFLPFQHILYSPTIILIGKVYMTEVPRILITQLVWVVVMGIICHFMWYTGKKKLVIQGG